VSFRFTEEEADGLLFGATSSLRAQSSQPWAWRAAPVEGAVAITRSPNTSRVRIGAALEARSDELEEHVAPRRSMRR
jgi:hypothetical protein